MARPKNFDILLQMVGGAEKYFRIDRALYRVSDLSAYAPRSATGGLTYSDQEHVNAIEMASAHGGMGNIIMTDPSRYKSASGVDPRHEGMITLAPARTSLDTTLTAIKGIAVDANYIYFGGTGGVRRWDGVGSITSINTGLANTNVISLFYNGETLFAGLTNHRIHSWNGATWTAVGVTYGDGNNNYSTTSICKHNGYHWHSQGGTNLIHYFRRGDGADAETGIAISSLDGSYVHPAEGVDYDPFALEIGPLGYEVKKLVSFNGMLYAFRNDGIWEIMEFQNGQFGARQVRNLQDYSTFDNFDAVFSRDDGMWMGWANKLERYTGQTSANFTPNPIDESFPPVIHDKPQAMYDVYDWLYVLLSGQLYAFNGTAMHILEKDVTGTGNPRTLGAFAGEMVYFPREEMLIAAVANGTDTDIYTWNISDSYSRAPYQASGYIDTSVIDFGFKAVPKFWHNITVESHIPTEGGLIRVTAYSHNENSIDTYELGIISSANAEAFVDGRWNKALTTFEFPKTATGKWIEFRFELERGTGANDPTPVLYGFILEAVQRNPTIWGFSPVIHLDLNDDGYDGWGESTPVRERLQTLIDMRDSITPLYFEDFWGHKGWVYISAITIRENEIEAIEGWDGQSADVAISMVMLARECDEVVVPDGETLAVEDTYRIQCRLVLEGTGRLEVT